MTATKKAKIGLCGGKRKLCGFGLPFTFLNHLLFDVSGLGPFNRQKKQSWTQQNTFPNQRTKDVFTKFAPAIE